VKEWNEFDPSEIVRKYRQFVYEIGAADAGKVRRESGDIHDKKVKRESGGFPWPPGFFSSGLSCPALADF